MLTSVTFCLICCCKVCDEASFDSPYRACGSGRLANLLGGANCVQNPSEIPGLRPASRRLQYARQLPVACSTLTASNGKLGKELGKKLVAPCVSAYQSSKQVYCNLSVSSVVLYKSTALLYGRQQNGQQVADKSKEMRRCQRIIAIL